MACSYSGCCADEYGGSCDWAYSDPMEDPEHLRWIDERSETVPPGIHGSFSYG